MEQLLIQNEDISSELLTHLKRNFKTYEISAEWRQTPIKFIVINGKSCQLSGNKKTLTNRIFNEVDGDWSNLNTDIKRRTIKKFLDGITL